MIRLPVGPRGDTVEIDGEPVFLVSSQPASHWTTDVLVIFQRLQLQGVMEGTEHASCESSIQLFQKLLGSVCTGSRAHGTLAYFDRFYCGETQHTQK